MHTVVLAFGDSLPACPPPPSSTICSPSLRTEGPGDWNVNPVHPIEKPHFISSQEQSNYAKDDFCISLIINCLQSPVYHCDLRAPVTQALHLFSLRGISRAMAGSPSAFPCSWFHSAFNEGAELSGLGRVSPSGTPLAGLGCLSVLSVQWVNAGSPVTPRKGLSSSFSSGRRLGHIPEPACPPCLLFGLQCNQQWSRNVFEVTHM